MIVFHKLLQAIVWEKKSVCWWGQPLFLFFLIIIIIVVIFVVVCCFHGCSFSWFIFIVFFLIVITIFPIFIPIYTGKKLFIFNDEEFHSFSLFFFVSLNFVLFFTFAHFLLIDWWSVHFFFFNIQNTKWICVNQFFFLLSIHNHRRITRVEIILHFIYTQ